VQEVVYVFLHHWSQIGVGYALIVSNLLVHISLNILSSRQSKI